MRILLIDTCGEIGSVALAEGGSPLAAVELPARAASSALLQGIKALLERAGWPMQEIEAVGVVSGPGSFTGVRVGLAAAKGLCEARGLPLATVSRLEVLQDAGGLRPSYAVLDAGRGELYVRRTGLEQDVSEGLYKREDFLALAKPHPVMITESRLIEPLGSLQPQMCVLDASAALPAVLRVLQSGGDDLERADANYVRSEQQIYGSQNIGSEPEREHG